MQIVGQDYGRYMKRGRQSGMVSIMVTMLMMVVISLVVLGFAEVSRREQRETLDRQLSSQAFFAAESGVNDARETIKTYLASGTNADIPEKNTCVSDGFYVKSTPDPTADSSYIDKTNNIRYSCLLVKTGLTDIQAEVGSDGDALKENLESTSSIDHLTINWQSTGSDVTQADVDKCTDSVGTLKLVTGGNAWSCKYGIVRVELVPIPNGSFTRASLSAGRKVFFLYPRKVNGTSVASLNTINGKTVQMNCGTTAQGGCNARINNVGGGNTYAIKISSIYQGGGRVTMQAKDAADKAVILKNAQVQVDATGQAQDVLRRIQVRLPLTSQAVPSYALESGSSICKRFEFTSTSFNIPNDLRDQDQNNPMCRTQSVAPPVPTCSVPSDIMLTLDTSNSMVLSDISPGVTRLDKLREVATRFVKNTSVGTLNHEGIISFSFPEWVKVEVGLTGSQPALTQAIVDMQNHFGTTYSPALNETTNSLNGSGSRAGARKVVLFMSDGEIDKTKETPAEVYAITDVMKAQGITVYTVGIGNDTAFTTLKGMASPGKFATALDGSQFDAVIDNIAKDFQCN